MNCGLFEKEPHHTTPRHAFHKNSTKGNVPSKYTTKILSHVQSVRYIIMFKLCTCQIDQQFGRFLGRLGMVKKDIPNWPWVHGQFNHFQLVWCYIMTCPIGLSTRECYLRRWWRTWASSTRSWVQTTLGDGEEHGLQAQDHEYKQPWSMQISKGYGGDHGVKHNGGDHEYMGTNKLQACKLAQEMYVEEYLLC